VLNNTGIAAVTSFKAGLHHAADAWSPNPKPASSSTPNLLSTALPTGPIPVNHPSVLDRLAALTKHALANPPALQAVNGINPFSKERDIVEPRSVAEVQQVVREARDAGKRVRVVGSAHTRPKQAICDDDDDDVSFSFFNWG